MTKKAKKITTKSLDGIKKKKNQDKPKSKSTVKFKLQLPKNNYKPKFKRLDFGPDPEEGIALMSKATTLMLFCLFLVLFGGGFFFLQLFLENKGKLPAAKMTKTQLIQSQEQAGQQQISQEEDNLVQVEVREQQQEPQLTTQDRLDADPSVFDTTDWNVYKSRNHYFTLKYPDSWPEPEIIEATKPEDEFSFKLFFKKQGAGTDSMPVGFEVIGYPARYFELIDTDPIYFKDFTVTEGLECKQFADAKVGPKNEYSAKEVYVPKDDPCYREAYFHSVEIYGRIYNFVPVTGADRNYIGYDGKNAASKNIPEFNTVLANVSFQKPPPPKPKATGPKPVNAKSVGGKLVCRGGDKTRWSLNNKPGHLDRECCLDPDETPNPWCTYSAENLAEVAKMKAKGPPSEWKKKWD